VPGVQIVAPHSKRANLQFLITNAIAKTNTGNLLIGAAIPTSVIPVRMAEIDA
jgi:hypothetical protein